MGLVSLQNTAGVDNLDFSIASDESLTDLSVMQATAAVEATNVSAGQVSVKDSAGTLVATEYDMPGTTSIDLAAVQQVTVRTNAAAEDLTTYPALASIADVIELNGPVTLNVDQAGLTLTGDGSYSVRDTAAEIEGAVTDTSAGVLAGATAVTAGDGLALNLTVDQYKQIDGNTVLTSGYRIIDEAANIEAEISADGTDLGVLAALSLLHRPTRRSP